MINDDRLLTRFKYWGEKQYTEEEAVILMVEYMAYIASGIDHRMYNIRKKASDIRLRVHLSGVLVIKDNKGLNWTNSIVYLDDDPSKPYLDADSAIGNLSRFVYNDPSAFSKFDHVMALTGQNIALWVPSTDTDYWEKGVLGYAYSGSMCTNPYYSVSVVEVPGLGNPARIATHEIAHTMSTGHDTKNGCRTADQYIMAEQVLPTTSENRRHPFEFSNCSIENIRDYLHGLNRLAVNPDYSENIGHCLKHHQAEKVFDNTEDKRFMGERFSYDEECKFLMDDPSAYACYIPNQSYCYGYMYCYWPSVDPLYQFCYAGCPYDGSPCNGTDVCYEGTCVPKSEALVEIPDTEALKQQEEIDASQ